MFKLGFIESMVIFVSLILLHDYLVRPGDIRGGGNACDDYMATCNGVGVDDGTICYTRGYGSCKYLRTNFKCGNSGTYFQNCDGKFLSADPQKNGGVVTFVTDPEDSCCFQLVEPLFGLRMIKCYSIQSSKHKGYFLRRSEDSLKLDQIAPLDSPLPTKLNYLFKFSKPPHDFNPGMAVYLLPVMENNQQGCFYSKGDGMHLRQGVCPGDTRHMEKATLYIGPVAQLDDKLCGSLQMCTRACSLRKSRFKCGPGNVHFRNCEGRFLSASPYQNGGMARFIENPDVSCCFSVKEGIFPGNPKAFSIESGSYPGHYLRHAGFMLRLDPKTDSGNQHTQQEFLFHLAKGINGDPLSVTLMPVQPMFNNSCFFYDDKRNVRFKTNHCPSTDPFMREATFYLEPSSIASRFVCGTTRECNRSQPEGSIKYGDTVRLKTTSNRYPGFLSPCGGTEWNCGVGVTLRPDKDFNVFEPNSKLRDWVIMGKPTSEQVRYGDVVQIKAMATNWKGHDGFLSPCGQSTGPCGVGVSLRPDAEFHRHEPNSNLRNWEITGDKPRGTVVKSGDRVKFRVDAQRWKGHTGFLALCGEKPGCGIAVSIRPDGFKDPFETHDTLKTWEILREGDVPSKERP